MFELDRDLAQSIVDRAMAILPCNVNVMDSQGLILGSGEPGRVDCRHEGAQLVLSNRRAVEIDAHTAACLQGVQPGINVPLLHEGELIGVLGLTGEPAALRTHAQLLRMTAEMLISQRQQAAQRHWREQRSEDVLHLLLNGTSAAPQQVDEATHLGLKPELARVPVVFEFAAPVNLGAVAEWLKARAPDSWCLPLAPHALVWCCPVRPGLAPSSYLERLAAQGWPPVRMAVGMAATGLPGVRKMLASVKSLLAYGCAVAPDEQLLSLARYPVASVLWAHRDNGAVEALVAIVEKVRANDSSGQLLETLRGWCRHSGQMQRCAEALGLHRNTLRYRMGKISEITGLDLNNLDDVLALYLALQLSPSAAEGAQGAAARRIGE